MRATGMIRRVDDLGRIVIPKEIRRTLHIHEGEALEIFTEGNGEILLKKYSPVGELGGHIRHLVEAVGAVSGHTICLCDCDRVLAAAGPLAKDYEDQLISAELERLLRNREERLAEKGERGLVSIIKEDPQVYRLQWILPMISAGDVIGGIAVLGREAFSAKAQEEKRMAKVLAEYFRRQVEA